MAELSSLGSVLVNVLGPLADIAGAIADLIGLAS
ncbi:hypothetical protein B840_11015 [Corynebacterium marinum DSM 44953]|uniref:Uncharacterized protein n=1 Tax=Corynebacterium marinum DSM 44953 TaxID=1224162 RepID=A0A0B6TW23_9CORY|nr:hypothetical protein B840_11015 [Corynebacterium marinum DSM 44953]